MRKLRAWRPPLRTLLLAAMAWNNLLAFPYLYGYSTSTLDRLVGAYGFERIACDGDVLARLADEHTKRWAAAEERACKALWRLWIAGAGAGGPAPWLDCYYLLRGRS
jgi:hypothetical protein